jgi:hypothetical protein
MKNIIEKATQNKIHKDIAKVVCSQCNAFHNLESENYIIIAGNIMVGLHGGIIGNNFDDKGKLNNVHIVCRKKKCWDDLFKDMFRKSVNE